MGNPRRRRPGHGSRRLEALRVREKAHTHEGDTIAAARRRLPKVEVDSTIRLIGPPLTVCYLREGDRVFETYWTTVPGLECVTYRESTRSPALTPGVVTTSMAR